MSRVPRIPQSTEEATWSLYRRFADTGYRIDINPPRELFTKYTWKEIGRRGFNIRTLSRWGLLLSKLYHEEGLSNFHESTIRTIAEGLKFLADERKNEGGNPNATPQFRLCVSIELYIVNPIMTLALDSGIWIN